MPVLDATGKPITEEVVEKTEVTDETTDVVAEVVADDKEDEDKKPEVAKPEAQAAEEEVAEVKEPEVDASGKIDAKEFETFKKARNAENKSLRDRLRSLEKAQFMSETGLTEAEISFLKGETLEELRASAEAYKALLPKVEDKPEDTKTPPKPEPKKFSAPPKGSTIAVNNGAGDIVANKDYEALAKILNQK